MVERIGLSVIVVVGVLAVLWAVPRYLSSDGNWPDILSILLSIADKWEHQTKWLDLVVGIAGVGILGAAAAMFRDPSLVGDLAGQVEFVAFSLAIVGFALLFGTTFVNTRRKGLYSAESTLIAMSLAGLILIVLVSALLAGV